MYRIDGAQTEFSATAYIGGVTPVTRIFIGPGEVIDEPGNNVPVRVAISGRLCRRLRVGHS